MNICIILTCVWEACCLRFDQICARPFGSLEAMWNPQKNECSTSAQPRSCAFVYSVCMAWMPFTPEFNPRSSSAATVDCHISGCLLLLFLPQTELAASRLCALLVFAQTSSSAWLSIILGFFVLAAGFPCTPWGQDSPDLCVSST